MTSRHQQDENNERRRVRRALLKQINEIVDPCSTVAGAPAGLVDFGLIRGVDLARNGGHGASEGAKGAWNVQVRLTLTEPTCIMGGPFAIRIRDKLTPLPAVASVEVKIQSTAGWTEQSMSRRYAAQLAAARARRVIPIAPHPAGAQA